MKYGYARVSTEDQNPDMQLTALKRAGCKTIFKDQLSGATGVKRPALLRCLKKLEHGDTLMVWKARQARPQLAATSRSRSGMKLSRSFLLASGGQRGAKLPLQDGDFLEWLLAVLVVTPVVVYSAYRFVPGFLQTNAGYRARHRKHGRQLERPGSMPS
jgi:hypothetical protein